MSVMRTVLAIHASILTITCPISVAAAGLRTGAATDSDREQILAGLKAWRQRMVSLSFVERKTLHDNPEDVATYVAWVWTDRGHYRFHTWVTRGGVVDARSVDALGIARPWSAAYARGPSTEDRPQRLVIDIPGGSPSKGHKIVGAMWGIWFPEAAIWLGERLLQDDVVWGAREKIGMHECVRVTINDTGGGPTTYFLDPQVGWLPREIRGVWQREFLDFAEPLPGWFFPRRGIWMRTDATGDFEITALEVNGPLPESLWQPPIADGTQVFDTLTMKTTIHGGARNDPQLLEEIASTAKDNSTRLSTEGYGSRPVRARRTNWPTWSTWLIAAGILLLVVALIPRFRGRTGL